MILHDYSLFNWSFTNSKLILIDFINQINIYQYLTVTYLYLVYAYIVEATFNQSWPVILVILVIPRPCLNREWYWNQAKEWFVSLIYFLHRLNCHIQDEALYNRRMLEGNLLLVCSLHWFWNFSLNKII